MPWNNRPQNKLESWSKRYVRKESQINQTLLSLNDNKKRQKRTDFSVSQYVSTSNDGTMP